MLHDDPSLFDLPHPVRVDAAFGRSMEEALFGAEFSTALKPYLGDETLPTEWILNHAPGMYELAQASSNYPGTLNLGLLSLVLARARLRGPTSAAIRWSRTASSSRRTTAGSIWNSTRASRRESSRSC